MSGINSGSSTMYVAADDKAGNTNRWSVSRAYGVDTDAPSPNPASFSSVTANSQTQISVVSTSTTHGGCGGGSATPYYFARISPSYSPGWQAGGTFVDTGLSCGTQYCYTVKYRDAFGNTGTTSSQSCATTASCNTPPSITAVSLSPTTVYTNQTINCYATATDTEQSTLTVYVDWYRNGTWFSSATASSVPRTVSTLVASIPGSSIRVGDSWYCRVYANDGLASSGTSNSNTVTILNVAPTCTIALSPSTAYSCSSPCTGDTVNGASLSYDTEGTTMSYQLYNYLNGAPTLVSSSTVANGGAVNWNFIPSAAGSAYSLLNLTDGHGGKGSCTSNTVTVTTRPNTAPTITSKYLTPGSLLPNQGFQLRAIANDNDGYLEQVNYGWILKKNSETSTLSGTTTGQARGADVLLATVSPPLKQGDIWTCEVWAYDGVSTSFANATHVSCSVYTVGANTKPTLTSISLAPACIKTGAVTLSTSGFADSNSDTIYLQVGTASAGTDLCNVTASTCSFGAQNYSGTGANTVYARAFDGLDYSTPIVSSTFSTDNAAPGTAPSLTTTPVGINQCNLNAAAATDTGCNGTVKYLFTRAGTGTTSGWISSNLWNDTGLSPHTTYNYTVQYKDGFDNTGAASSIFTCLSGDTAPTLGSISVSPACIKAGTVTVTAISASDANGDALTLQAGAATGQSGLCTGGGTLPSCTFSATSIGTDTASHTVYGRVIDGYGGTSSEMNSAAAFSTDNSGPSTTPQIISVAPNGTAQLDLTAPASGITDNGCAGLGALTYNFTRVNGTSYGWQAGNTKSATSLLPHTNYCFTVQYQDAFGNAGAVSAQVCNTTGNTAPSAPTNIVPNGGQNFLSAASDLIALSWGASSDTDGDAITYTMEYSSNSGSNWTVIGTTTATSYNWDSSAVSNGIAYRVRVKASDAYGGVSGYAASASDFALRHNTAPSISSVVLAPIVAYTTDTLNCSATALDAEQGNVTIYVDWYKNGALQAALSSSALNVQNNTLTRVATLGAGNLTANDIWYCNVRAYDYMVNSSWSPSTPTTAVRQGCGVLSAGSTTYTLATGIAASGSNCFNVTGASVTIDCNNQTITGTNAAGVYGVYSIQAYTTVRNCVFVNFTNAINLNGASAGLFYSNTFISSTGTHVNVSASTSGNKFYLNNFGATTGAYVSDLNGNNLYNTTLSGHGEGNAYANVLDGSVPIFGSTQSVGMPLLNVGSSGGGYPYRNTTSNGKFSCNFAACADYAPIIPRILVTYTCRISPDAPYTSDTLQGYAGAPGSLPSNVTYYYQWYLNGTLNCTGNEGSVHVG